MAKILREEIFLFGVVKLTKNDGDFNKYKYSGYGFGFDGSEKNFLMAVGFGKNVIFDDMSLLVHIDNKK